MTGFSDKVSDFDFTFEDTEHGLGVEETSDSPMVEALLLVDPKDGLSRRASSPFMLCRARPRSGASITVSLPALLQGLRNLLHEPSRRNIRSLERAYDPVGMTN